MFNEIMFIIIAILIIVLNLMIGFFVGYKYGFHKAYKEYKKILSLNDEYCHTGSYNNLIKPPTIPPVTKEGE